MKDALAIHRWLLTHQVHHEIVRLPRPLTCAHDLPDVMGLPPENCVAVSVFDADTDLVAVIVPAGLEPRPEVIKAFLGYMRVTPATARRVNTATEYAAGLVSPVLLPDEMTVLIDQSLLGRLAADDVVYTPTGESRTALGIRAFDLFALSGAKPVEIA